MLGDSQYFLCPWKMTTTAYDSVSYLAMSSMHESNPDIPDIIQQQHVLNEDIMSTFGN